MSLVCIRELLSEQAHWFNALQASKLYNKANQMASDAFSACRTVAAFNMRGEIYRMYCQLLDAPEQESNKRCAFFS